MVNAVLAAALTVALAATTARAGSLPSGSDPTEDARQAAVYDGCIRKAQSDPDAAYADAIAWHRLGGGLPARHCAAVALVGRRQFDEAAARLETLSRDAPQEEDRKSVVRERV